MLSQIHDSDIEFLFAGFQFLSSSQNSNLDVLPKVCYTRIWSQSERNVAHAIAQNSRDSAKISWFLLGIN